MATNINEMFKIILEQMPDGIIILDTNDEIIFVNNMAEEIRHVKAEQVVGRNVVSCHSEKSHEKVRRALEYLKKGEQKNFKRMIVDHKDGRYYENTYTTIRDISNNYIGSIVISRDITEKRKLEEEKATHLQNLEEKVSELTKKNQDLFVSSMSSLVNVLEAKDPYTKGHSLRVCDIAVNMAEYKWGVSPESRETELAGSLHDIGKVGVRETILNKLERLTNEEFDHIKEHPVIGEKILEPFEKLKPVAKIVRYHHERFDGKGYPDSLIGEDIPVNSRILAIADAYDAMTSTRSYRPAMDSKKAADEIKKHLGTQFDPQWGEIFLELFYSGSIG